MAKSKPVLLVIPQDALRNLVSPAINVREPEDKKTDQHNEVERRRKAKISSCIRRLSETLNPSCHCGRTTTAEVLQRVVEQIKTLQEENSLLEGKISQLPQPGSESELSLQLVKLLVEHVILRAQLFEHLEKQRESSKPSETPVEDSSERAGGTPSISRQQSWPVTSLLSCNHERPVTSSAQPFSCQSSCIHPPTEQRSLSSNTNCSAVAVHSRPPVSHSSRPPIVQPWVDSNRLRHVNHVHSLRPSPRHASTQQPPYSHRERERHQPYLPRQPRVSPPSVHPTTNTAYSNMPTYSSLSPSDCQPPPYHHTIQPPPRHYPPLSHPTTHGQGAVWRPYSERSRASGFCLADILSLPPSDDTSALHLEPQPQAPQGSGNNRIPSFLVDHLLDDI